MASSTVTTSTVTTPTRWRNARLSLLAPPPLHREGRWMSELPSPTYKSVKPVGWSRWSSSLLPRRKRLVYALLSVCLFLFTWRSVLFGENDNDAKHYYYASHGGNATASLNTSIRPSTDLEHLRRWIEYSGDHLIDSFDRISFAQMGFQARMYAHVLQDSAVPGHMVRDFERKLWSFVPGLPQLRKAHGHREAKEEEHHPTKEAQSSFSLSAAQKALERMRLGAPKAATELAPVAIEAVNATETKAFTRGMVVVTGDYHFDYTVHLIASIRQGHHCDLPIEVYYCGHDDLSPINRRYLENTFDGVTVIDLLDLDLFDESFVELVGGGWALKPYAAMASNFTEVILADADSIPLADPHDFFTEKGYVETGTLFFHDRYLPRWKNEETSKFLRNQYGRRGPSLKMSKTPFHQQRLSHFQESGLVVLNKSNTHVFAALLFTLWQNAGFVRDEMTYILFHGDKESYWLSHELAGFPYHFSPFYAGAIGPEEAAHMEGFCSDHQLHLMNAETTTKHNLECMTKETRKRRSGKAAWLNGSLLKNKIYGEKADFMDLTSTIWSTDGIWDYVSAEGGSTFCFNKYTRRSMSDLEPLDQLGTLFSAGQQGAEQAQRRMNEGR